MDYKISFTFTKKKEMIYISHLDLMRLFMRALRRAGIPVKITEGFNPHPKISIKRALKLGVESENEEASVVIKNLMRKDDFKERLQRQFPEGIEIKSVVLSA